MWRVEEGRYLSWVPLAPSILLRTALSTCLEVQYGSEGALRYLSYQSSTVGTLPEVPTQGQLPALSVHLSVHVVPKEGPPGNWKLRPPSQPQLQTPTSTYLVPLPHLPHFRPYLRGASFIYS